MRERQTVLLTFSLMVLRPFLLSDRPQVLPRVNVLSSHNVRPKTSAEDMDNPWLGGSTRISMGTFSETPNLWKATYLLHGLVHSLE